MVPPPSNRHQVSAMELGAFLLQVGRPRGLQVSQDTGIYLADDDYRVPDLVVTLPEHRVERGVEGGAELVVELLSPHDESREKLPFYAQARVREVLFFHPITREVELVCLLEGEYRRVVVDDRGRLVSASLGVSFARLDGPIFEAATLDGALRVRL